VQAADLLVEVDRSVATPDMPPSRTIGLGGHLDRAAQRVAEADEAGRGGAAFGQGVELLFGRLDLVAGGARLVAAAMGGRGDLAADADQVAAQGQVEDRAGIVADVRGRRGAVDQVGQIAQAAQLVEGRVLLELVGQQDRLGQLALADVGLDRLEQALVERLVEVPRVQGVGQPFIGRVVVQQHAEQGLFSLQIMRRHVDRDVGMGWAQIKGRDERHRSQVNAEPELTRGHIGLAHQMNGDVLCMFWRALATKKGAEIALRAFP
jgi:hypothetical protein